MAGMAASQAVERWAASGLLALTGPAGGAPLGPPAPLVPRLDELATPFGGLDPLLLLAERAAIAGHHRAGRTSCGGSCRLLRTADGWLAVSLPRGTDVDAVPAWLEVDPVPEDETWDLVAAEVRGRSTTTLEHRAALLDLPVAALGGARPRDPVVTTVLGSAPPQAIDGARVLDLSSLWAGPLCGSLLATSGARVVKVEAVARPDGARTGPAAFFDLLNAGKCSVALDFGTATGRAALARLVAAADVVIESSRPRALERLGIDAGATVTSGRGPRVWVSITAHGRDGDATRVGFGDDCAVAGGLVAMDPARPGDGPWFCADALADPLTGITAAAACLDALAAGGRRLLDVAMSAVAADVAGPALPVPDGTRAAAPRARAPQGRAAALGTHTDAELAGLAVASPP
jgi:hypothetical protein